MANSAVFNFRRNAGSDWISLTEVGREFQAHDAAARNTRSPMVARRVIDIDGTGESGGESDDCYRQHTVRNQCCIAAFSYSQSLSDY